MSVPVFCDELPWPSVRDGMHSAACPPGQWPRASPVGQVGRQHGCWRLLFASLPRERPLLHLFWSSFAGCRTLGSQCFLCCHHFKCVLARPADTVTLCRGGWLSVFSGRPVPAGSFFSCCLQDARGACVFILPGAC